SDGALREDLRARAGARRRVRRGRAARLAREAAGGDAGPRARALPHGEALMARLACIEKSRFLGREFRVWLWHESEHAEGVLPIGEGESVSLWLEKQLTLTSEDLLGRHECRLKGSTPSLTSEAKEALRAGKLPVKAKIRIDRSEASDGR